MSEVKNNKIENPIQNKSLPKRNHLNIRFNTDEAQEIVYEYDRFLEQKILEHKNSKKRTPKPKTNDFYIRALIRGMKYDLFDNKTDEIANIAAKAVTKVIQQNNQEITVRQNLQTAFIAGNMDYLKELLNYIVPILQGLNYEYFDATIDKETGFIKNDFFKTPVGFENQEISTQNKWKNKIRKDSSSTNLKDVLFGKGNEDD
ncbi:hypothetical protein EELLY_v1c03700 [Entomoplasma ellychniae]|uniref:Uncharacterized protein n=1 Tax=Entomoplasma ellychniae TaxID=2114 RepID=A0A8E2QZF2_9MOLU|nr:hypothetical protein [Entomoplasma ellychniae]PPE04349.1 hypothetical protein EELLY_v1c00230 [Entomoplasma ellychniae]PPE04619.1 hypothetical protein EELLY_v1c02990 [Entomoplasma ellychniae]PPE04690.1 hypothetical protein EELLY_v1c03700 [Entomoplasma ellychniae]